MRVFSTVLSQLRLERMGFLILAFYVFTACQKLAPNDVVGTYTFRGDKIQETLQLKPEGTYSQEIKSNGQSFTATGDWSVKGPRTIIFRGLFLVRSDAQTRQIIVPPEKFSYHTGTSLSDARIISFDAEENKYIVTREMSQ